LQLHEQGQVCENLCWSFAGSFRGVEELGNEAGEQRVAWEGRVSEMWNEEECLFAACGGGEFEKLFVGWLDFIGGQEESGAGEELQGGGGCDGAVGDGGKVEGVICGRGV
jgi:hypothetical protein